MKSTVISDREMRSLNNSGDINVQVVQCTAEEARKLIDVVEDEALCAALDEAQGDVFGGNAPIAYVVLKIVAE